MTNKEQVLQYIKEQKIPVKKSQIQRAFHWISKIQLSHILSKLKGDGKIFSPSHGYYKNHSPQRK